MILNYFGFCLIYLFVFMGINSVEVIKAEAPTGNFSIEDYFEFVREHFITEPISNTTEIKHIRKTPNMATLRWKGFRSQNNKWAVPVPYIFDRVDNRVKQHFQNVVQAFNKNSCIRWVPRTNERDFVRVQGVGGSNRCYASIGIHPGRTMMYVNPACLGINGHGYSMLFNLAHEMMHVLGFIHEHQRRDRNCYIWISGNSERYDFGNMGRIFEHADETFPYDKWSIMQYPGNNAMRSLVRGERIGPKTTLPNDSDWIRLNHVYCGQPHYCKIYPGNCQRTRQILEQCRRRQG